MRCDHCCFGDVCSLGGDCDYFAPLDEPDFEDSDWLKRDYDEFLSEWLEYVGEYRDSDWPDCGYIFLICQPKKMYGDELRQFIETQKAALAERLRKTSDLPESRP